jgi:hypothetical protein
MIMDYKKNEKGVFKKNPTSGDKFNYEPTALTSVLEIPKVIQ